MKSASNAIDGPESQSHSSRAEQRAGPQSCGCSHSGTPHSPFACLLLKSRNWRLCKSTGDSPGDLVFGKGPPKEAECERARGQGLMTPSTSTDHCFSRLKKTFITLSPPESVHNGIIILFFYFFNKIIWFLKLRSQKRRLALLKVSRWTTCSLIGRTFPFYPGGVTPGGTKPLPIDPVVPVIDVLSAQWLPSL